MCLFAAYRRRFFVLVAAWKWINHPPLLQGKHMPPMELDRSFVDGLAAWRFGSMGRECLADRSNASAARPNFLCPVMRLHALPSPLGAGHPIADKSPKRLEALLVQTSDRCRLLFEVPHGTKVIAGATVLRPDSLWHLIDTEGRPANGLRDCFTSHCRRCVEAGAR